MNGEKKRLGEYQIKLLEVLLENAGRIMSREELTALVWERRVIGSNSLPNAIHALRAALEDDGKKQRIIKTLPKKGYILEAEYCTQVEKEESEIRAEFAETDDSNATVEDAILTSEESIVTEAEFSEQEEQTCLHCAEDSPAAASARVSKPDQRSAFFRLFVVLGAMALSLMVAISGSYLVHAHDSQMTLSSREDKLFDHITIYEVKSTTDADKTDMYLFSQLKDTYTRLNEALKARGATMTVYYHYVQQTLNYTFVMKNGCDEKEMILYFYHWHSDNAALNQTILDQTMGTLNEMATCK